jgi:23S rRNA pseudouridine2604 synthase
MKRPLPSKPNKKTTEKAEKPDFPMRINKYLAKLNITTRRGADEMIEKRQVFLNGVIAKLGDKVNEGDNVEVKHSGIRTDYVYYAYNKPVGVITHSPQVGEQDVLQSSNLKGVFPVGRLDKNSHGLMILTNDGRLTDKLLNPDYDHQKEYVVTVKNDLRASFKEYMEKGVDLGDYVTKPCKVKIISGRVFGITLTEGKKHQIRRMCEAMHNEVTDLQRVRIMNIRLGRLLPNAHRKIEGGELEALKKALLS